MTGGEGHYTDTENLCAAKQLLFRLQHEGVIITD